MTAVLRTSKRAPCVGSVDERHGWWGVGAQRRGVIEVQRNTVGITDHLVQHS